MSYWSIEIEVPAHLADDLAWLLADKLDHAVETQDEHTLTTGVNAHTARLVIHLDKSPSHEQHQAIHTVLADFGMQDAPIRTAHSNDNSWQLGWRAFFQPTALANHRVIVHPPWDIPPQNKDQLHLVIDPGLAFGTGTHHTTQLAASLLYESLDGKTSLTRVLDQGCGSGILGLIAAALGHRVDGVEVDEMAADNAKHNVLLNQLNDRMQINCSAQVPTTHKYSIVIANIIAPVLIELASALQEVSTDELILSGLREEQEERILKIYHPWTVIQRITEAGWVALRLRYQSCDE